MKAQVIKQFGEPSVFEIADVTEPEVTPGHVVIQVKATSVNPIDTKVRKGLVPAVAPEFPAILHGDVAGVVTDTGEGVTEFRVGDEVYGCAGGFKGTEGALAEYMLADVQLLAPKPENLTMAQAASLPLVTITAWESLYNRANVQNGQKVLVHAATGGVGHVAIQLAKIAGAKVSTTASSTKKLNIGKNIGADEAINYREQTVDEYVKEYTDGKGFDIVFDTVGGENLDLSFQAATTYGTILTIASRSTHDLSSLNAKALSLHVTFMLLKVMNKERRQDYGNILRQANNYVEQGKLQPLVNERTFTFDQINEAHTLLESNKAIGKIVLTNEW